MSLNFLIRFIAMATVAIASSAIANHADAAVVSADNHEKEIRPVEVCASNRTQLNLTARLRSLIDFFPIDATSGFINQTRGSYFEISIADPEKSNTEATDRRFIMTFFTSGLFDIYLIRKSGPVVFCDDGIQLIVKGLDRAEPLKVQDDLLVFGDGGPKKIFKRGEMPELLKKLSGDKS